jgi:hypothetical protein
MLYELVLSCFQNPSRFGNIKLRVVLAFVREQRKLLIPTRCTTRKIYCPPPPGMIGTSGFHRPLSNPDPADEAAKAGAILELSKLLIVAINRTASGDLESPVGLSCYTLRLQSSS